MVVTPLYAGLLTLWFALLSVRVMNIRRSGIAFGDRGDIGVTRIVRAQANFAEYVSLALLLMGFLRSLAFQSTCCSAWHNPSRGTVVPWPCALFGWQARFGRVSGAALKR